MARALVLGEEGADLSPADQAMIEYALILTRDPGAMGPELVDRLREHGFDDTAILDICQVTAYYNYVNRLAEGLGVELEERGWAEGNMVLSRKEFEERP